MTREEAIKRLEVVRTNALIQKANGASEYWQEEIDGTIEAIDMAIEALSADTVSREAHYDAVANRITDMEERGFVSVVRCKDCRHGQYDATHYFCSEHYHKVYADDFCSHGERQCNYFGERR